MEFAISAVSGTLLLNGSTLMAISLSAFHSNGPKNQPKKFFARPRRCGGLKNFFEQLLCFGRKTNFPHSSQFKHYSVVKAAGEPDFPMLADFLPAAPVVEGPVPSESDMRKMISVSVFANTDDDRRAIASILYSLCSDEASKKKVLDNLHTILEDYEIHFKDALEELRKNADALYRQFYGVTKGLNMIDHLYRCDASWAWMRKIKCYRSLEKPLALMHEVIQTADEVRKRIRDSSLSDDDRQKLTNVVDGCISELKNGEKTFLNTYIPLAKTFSERIFSLLPENQKENAPSAKPPVVQAIEEKKE